MKTKAVDEILTGQKSLDLSRENFPVLNKTEDNQIVEVQVADEAWKRNLKNVSHSIVEPRSHRGYTLKEGDDKPKNFILPGTPLQEMVASKSKENEQLVKESPTPQKIEDFRKGFVSKMFEFRGFFDEKPVIILKRIQAPKMKKDFNLTMIWKVC